MRINKALSVLVLSGLLVAIPTTPVAAATTQKSIVKSKASTESVGGGLWQFGVESTVFSYYHHATKSHTATACNGSSFGQKCSQVAAVKNSWANATITKTPSGNTAFWNTL